jgi:hypothetical protein
MFGFDMLVHGVRGDQLPEEDLTEEELEVYGVHWEGLHEEQLLRSQRANNPTSEGWSSWVGRIGPPKQLNAVHVYPPIDSLQPSEVDALDETLRPWLQGSASDDAEIIALWTHALAYAQTMHYHIFSN